MPVPPILDSAIPNFDREKTIEQLIEVDRKPIHRIDLEIKNDNNKIQAWEELRNRTQKLENLSRDLYTIDNPFRQRLLVASDPEAVTGTAKPNTPQQKQTWQINQLASDHEIRSEAQQENWKKKHISAGTFSVAVGKKTRDFYFSGGSSEDLYDFLKQEGDDLFAVEKSSDGSKKYIRLKSKIPGAQGRLHFRDPDAILQSVDFLDKGPRIVVISPSNSPNSLSSSARGQANDQFGIRLKPGESYYQAIDPEILEHANPSVWAQTDNKSRQMLLDVKTLTLAPVKKDSIPSNQTKQSQKQIIEGDAVTVGPEIIVDVEGELQFTASNLKRRPHTFPTNEKEQDDKNNEDSRFARLTVEIFAMPTTDEGKGGQKTSTQNVLVQKKTLQINPNDQPLRVPLSQIPSAIRLTTEDELEITKLSIDFGEGVRIKNQLSKPQDSHVEIDNIALRRPKNTDLDDLIPNASITLHKVTEQPITVKITEDQEAIKNGVQGWVEAYNHVISYLRATGHAPIGDLNQPSDERPGALLAETTARTLQYSLQNVVTRPYTPYSKSGFKTLVDTGIHTGKPGESFENVKAGLLKVDKKRLQQVLDNHSQEFAHLFSSRAKISSNQLDKQESDDGLAVQMFQYLQPYNRSNSGIIANQVIALKDRIRRSKKNQESLEESLQRKEDSLRRDFTRMEQSVRKSKSTGKYLDRQTRSNQRDR